MDIVNIEDPKIADISAALPKEPTKLPVGGEFELPKDLIPGRVIVFGREPRTQDPRYRFYDNEVEVKFDNVDRTVPRRGLALQKVLGGGYIITNLSQQNIGWGLDEKTFTLKPQERQTFPANAILQNLHINFPGISLQVKEVGISGAGQEIRSLSLAKIPTVQPQI